MQTYRLGFDADLPKLEPGFDDLPVDPYTPGDFRFRRYSAFRFTDGVVTPLPAETFTQSSRVNQFLGDVERDYPPIAEATWRDPRFARMFAHFDAHTAIAVGDHVGVHQVRIYKTPGAAMAPEGRHRDGFDRIGVFMIDVHNIDGGHLRLSRSMTAPAFLDTELIPGDFVVLNDRRLFHNASPIRLRDPGHEGFVDFFVLTSHDDDRTLH